MFDLSFIINVTFRWINFLIIVGAIVYLFRKKALPQIKALILDQKQFFVSLHKQLKQVQESNTKVNKQIDAQQTESARLLGLMQQWKSQVTEQKQQQQALYEERAEHLEQLRQEQLERFAVDRAQHKLIPHAITKASDQLKDMFKTQHAQDEYLDELIKYMKKRT